MEFDLGVVRVTADREGERSVTEIFQILGKRENFTEEEPRIFKVSAEVMVEEWRPELKANGAVNGNIWIRH